MASDKQQSKQDDKKDDGHALISRLIDFALQVFAVRSEEDKWQQVLQNAPTDIISFLSNHPDVMAGILQASSEDQVKDLVRQGMQNAKETPSAAPDEAASAAQASTDEDQVTATPAEEGAHDEAASAAQASTDEDQAATAEAHDAVQQVEGKPEGEGDGKDKVPDDAASPSNNEDECSDEMLIECLKKIFLDKDHPEGLGSILADADSSVLRRLDENPFYVSEVINMRNENEFNDFISQLQSSAGPIELTDAVEGEAISEELVGELLNNWAYINFDCQITNKDNPHITEYDLDKGIITWTTDVGAPVICIPHEEGKVTVALSMQGTLDAYDPANSEDSEQLPDYMTGVSPSTRRMIAAFNIVDFLQSFEMGDVKVRSGHRNLLRNFWAICNLNGIACAGFEPTSAELMWYQKRESVLRDKFVIDQQMDHTHAPGMSPSGGSAPIADGAQEQASDQEVAHQNASPDVSEAAVERPVDKQEAGASSKSDASGDSGSDQKEAIQDQEKTEEQVSEDQPLVSPVDAPDKLKDEKAPKKEKTAKTKAAKSVKAKAKPKTAKSSKGKKKGQDDA